MSVILIPDENIRTYKVAIIGLAGGGDKFTRLWNSEARFIVAAANKFSMSTQTDKFDFF
jgi:hypothetical protein